MPRRFDGHGHLCWGLSGLVLGEGLRQALQVWPGADRRRRASVLLCRGAAGTSFVLGQASLPFPTSTRPSDALWLRSGDGALMLAYSAGLLCCCPVCACGDAVILAPNYPGLLLAVVCLIHIQQYLVVE
jgi:hypothetical protein